VTLTQQRGWSNAKRLPAIRRAVDAVVKDSAAAGLVAVAVLGAAGVAILLPRPAGIAVTIAAVAAGGLGWRVRRGGQPVSFLIDRARWEARREQLAGIPGLEVEVGAAARAVDHDGTIYDVRLTCRRRDADAVQDTL